jgi:hypothetical protein
MSVNYSICTYEYLHLQFKISQHWGLFFSLYWSRPLICSDSELIKSADFFKHFASIISSVFSLINVSNRGITCKIPEFLLRVLMFLSDKSIMLASSVLFYSVPEHVFERRLTSQNICQGSKLQSPVKINHFRITIIMFTKKQLKFMTKLVK